MTNWEKEKAYTARRAAELASLMNQAIEAVDEAAFEEAYQKAMRYMKRGELRQCLNRFTMALARTAFRQMYPVNTARVPGGCYWMPGCEENPPLPESEWLPEDTELPFI